MVTQSERFIEAIVSLYYLVSSADGKISDFEKKICERMIKSEQIDISAFDHIMASIRHLPLDEVYRMCINLLKSCTREEQTRALAWMRSIANSDGFMAKEEWSLIFKIYKKELQLSLKEIIEFKLPQSTNLPD